MAKDLKVGDPVAWNTPQGETHGTVTRRLTSRTTVAGQVIAASKDSPRYLVVSDRTGAEAAHTADALRRR